MSLRHGDFLGQFAGPWEFCDNAKVLKVLDFQKTSTFFFRDDMIGYVLRISTEPCSAQKSTEPVETDSLLGGL